MEQYYYILLKFITVIQNVTNLIVTFYQIHWLDPNVTNLLLIRPSLDLLYLTYILQ